uniref:Rho1 guanine nucleotide exchange factor 1 n=1 Tax=Psilocybe cubensis TaxID=181762 RepID=A0A8H7Y279_PSICU
MYEQRRSSVALPGLPPGAQPPVIGQTSSAAHAFPASTAYNFEVTPPMSGQEPLPNPWDAPFTSNRPPQMSRPTRPRVVSMQDTYPTPLASHGAGPRIDTGQRIAFPFPDPNYYRSTSYRNEMQSGERPTHHHSNSDLASPSSASTLQPPQPLHHRNTSVTSFASSFNGYSEDGHFGSDYHEADYQEVDNDSVRALTDQQLASEEGLRRFQAGELSEKDQEWHRLVPEEARDALGKQEVQRQSVIFEVIKSERDYVADLEAVEAVYVEGLRMAKPPIISSSRLGIFINEVFQNLRIILSYHQRILAALFARQREQHPLIQSVADIILDTALGDDFRSNYETYIKQYPLAESRHRKQMKSNRAYETFIQSVSNDPRIRKRDLITFLSRPVTKLPRLNLLLEQLLKLTDAEYDHPDLQTLPIILGILKDCIKSTQPGIEAAESKVKFWGLCESLVFQKGEIIDMDLYDGSRTLVYLGPVMRRSRTETSFSDKWVELTAALLDNYFLLTREEKRANGTVRRLLMSRPLPLSFLRLGAFNTPPEPRREKAEDGGLLDRYRNVPMYPFTIYHAASRSTRRYTLYTASDALRKKWYNSFVDTIGVHKVRQEANMWFNPQTLTDGYFRSVGRDFTPVNGMNITGRIQCAVPFFNGSRRFLAVGCGPGVYVAPVKTEKYRLAVSVRTPNTLAAFITWGDKIFNRLVVQVDSSLTSYSLDILARFADGQTDSTAVDASKERIAGNDSHIVFFRHVHLGGRALLIYCSKRRLASSMTLQVLEALDVKDLSIVPRRSIASNMHCFRPYGEPGYIPKDAYDIVALSKTVGVCTNDGIVTLDPTNIVQSAVNIIPDLKDGLTNEPMALLKARLEGKRPLGFVKVDQNELLVIYDEMGCYINKHGVPVRRSGFIKWEIKAVSYAYRNGHILLVSPEFIEIRNAGTGRIVQVIEGQDIRLLYSGPYSTKDDPVLVVMRGKKDDKEGVSERIAELVQTEEISVMTPAVTTPSASVWDEWDM